MNDNGNFALKAHDAKRAEKMRAWRATRRAAVTLSSGLEVLLKKVAVLDLAAHGEIPQTLSAIADEFVNGKTEIKLEEFPRFAGLVNAVVCACVIDPPLGEVEDDAHLTLDEIPMEDRIEIFRWANEGASALEPFRAKSEADVGIVPTDERVGSAAE